MSKRVAALQKKLRAFLWPHRNLSQTFFNRKIEEFQFVYLELSAFWEKILLLYNDITLIKSKVFNN